MVKWGWVVLLNFSHLPPISHHEWPPTTISHHQQPPSSPQSPPSSSPTHLRSLPAPPTIHLWQPLHHLRPPTTHLYKHHHRSPSPTPAITADHPPPTTTTTISDTHHHHRPPTIFQHCPSLQSPIVTHLPPSPISTISFDYYSKLRRSITTMIATFHNYHFQPLLLKLL